MPTYLNLAPFSAIYQYLLEPETDMMTLVAPTSEELRYTSIGLYAISLFFILVCVINNVRIVKKVRFQDIILFVGFVLYSGMLSLIIGSGYYASNNIPVRLLEDILTDPTEVHQRIVGSILILSLEQTAVLTIWAIKMTLIMALFHLTSIEQFCDAHSALKWITAYTFGGFVVLEASMFGFLCRPVNQYWAVPVNDMQCVTYSIFSIIHLSFDLSSSIMIMGIAGSVAYNSCLSISRKVLIIILFAMGIITVLAAILSLYYRFNVAEPSLYRLWDIIEASTAIWIGSVVCSWRLLIGFLHRRSFENVQRGHPIQNTLLRAQQSETCHNRNITRWGRFIAFITLRPTNRTAQQDHEMNNRGRRSRIRHTTTASTGTVMLPHAELSQYLNGPGPRFNNTTFLAEDPDTGPALAYRLVNRID